MLVGQWILQDKINIEMFIWLGKSLLLSFCVKRCLGPNHLPTALSKTDIR